MGETGGGMDRTRTWLIVWGVVATVVAVAAVAALFITGGTGLIQRPGQGRATSAGSAEATGAARAAAEASAAAAAVRPAPAGEKLDRVTQPPTRTIAFLSPKMAKKGVIWDATFELYGFGPAQGRQKTVVVRILSAEPKGSKKVGFDPEGRNAILVPATPGDLAAMKVGGSYSGKLEVVELGGMLALEVSSVRAK